MDKKELENLIDKLGIHDKTILIECLDGGNIMVKVSKIEIIQFINSHLTCSLFEWLDFKYQINEIKRIYSAPNKIIDMRLFKSIFFERDFELSDSSSELISPIEYIDLIYERKQFYKIAPKEKFLEILGFDFIFLASVNFEIAKKKIENKKDVKNTTEGLVYLFKIKSKNHYKIGVTTNLSKRINQISLKMPFELEVIHTIKCKNIYELEKEFHEKFKKKNINGEWFELSKDDIIYIQNFK